MESRSPTHPVVVITGLAGRGNMPQKHTAACILSTALNCSQISNWSTIQAASKPTTMPAHWA